MKGWVIFCIVDVILIIVLGIALCMWDGVGFLIGALTGLGFFGANMITKDIKKSK